MTNIKRKNNNIYYIITVIIIGLFFSLIYFSTEISSFIKKIRENKINKVVKIEKNGKKIEKKLIVTVIDDKRCLNCNTKNLIFQLKQSQELSNADFQIKDFSDIGVKNMLIQNNIKKLPAFIFSNNKVSKDLSKFLKKRATGKYTLDTGAKFDPYDKNIK